MTGLLFLQRPKDGLLLTGKIFDFLFHFSQRLMYMEDLRSIKIAGVPLFDFLHQVIYSLNPSGPDKTEVNEH